MGDGYTPHHLLGLTFTLSSVFPILFSEKKEFLFIHEKLGINVELQKEVTLEMIQEMTPNVVIVATRAIPRKPGVEGVSGGNVRSAASRFPLFR